MSGWAGFWPQGLAGNLVLWVTFGVVAPLSFWLLRKVGHPEWPINSSPDYLVWERDRVQAVAKGTATSAVGFLTALVIALLKQDIKTNVPGLAVLGCLMGAVGLLLLAAQMSLSVQAKEIAK